MTAIVTCGHTRPSLAAVRALGRAGVAVAVAAPMRPALAQWSRHATSTLLVPDPEREARRFANTVADEAVGRNANLVLCSTDAALWALSRWREQLPESARRAMPPHDAVARVLDRSALVDRARALSIPSVDAMRVDAGDQVEPALLRLQHGGGHPVIVRPLVPWVEREDGSRRVAESIPVSTIRELRQLLTAREDLVAGGVWIEPRPPGRWLGYGAVCDEGRVIAEVFQERLRERGDLSGVSTLARTIAPDERVRDSGRRLLDALGWQGPALVEMLRSDDGVLRVVNVIGRLWGSLQLSIDAGVNVPLLLQRLADGTHRDPRVTVSEPGHVWRWVVGDTEVLLMRARRLLGRLEGARAVRRRASLVRELLDVRALKRARPDVFDADDPLPFVLEAQHRMREIRRATAARALPARS